MISMGPSISITLMLGWLRSPVAWRDMGQVRQKIIKARHGFDLRLKGRELLGCNGAVCFIFHLLKASVGSELFRRPTGENVIDWRLKDNFLFYLTDV